MVDAVVYQVEDQGPGSQRCLLGNREGLGNNLGYYMV